MAWRSKQALWQIITFIFTFAIGASIFFWSNFLSPVLLFIYKMMYHHRSEPEVYPVETKIVTKKYVVSPKPSRDHFLKTQQDLLQAEASSFGLNPFPEGRRINRSDWERPSRRHSPSNYDDPSSLSLKRSRELRKRLMDSVSRSPQRDSPETEKYQRELDKEERKLLTNLLPDYGSERAKNRYCLDEELSSVQSDSPQRKKKTDHNYRKLMTVLQKLTNKLEASGSSDERRKHEIPVSETDLETLGGHTAEEDEDGDAFSSMRATKQEAKETREVSPTRMKSTESFVEDHDDTKHEHFPSETEVEMLNGRAAEENEVDELTPRDFPDYYAKNDVGDHASMEKKPSIDMEAKHKDLKELQTAKLIMLELINQKIEEIGKDEYKPFVKDLSAGDCFACQKMQRCTSSHEVRQMKQMRQKCLAEIKQLVDRIDEIDQTIAKFQDCGHNYQ